MAEENNPTPEHKPYVAPETHMPELTFQAVILGAVLGIVFGASSLYLVLMVGMTVSASVPIAVLSITLFRTFSNSFKLRRATILENNIVQTAGSAGESIAFGVGVTMPALLLLGFEMDVTRVMTVSVLGGLLGILMMIPLRRAFIVKQHGKLIYPEGTACAEVLVAGEKGGQTARMVFVGFGVGVAYKFLSKACGLWAEEPSLPLFKTNEDGTKEGLRGAEISGELSPELLGVGFLIGPKIAALMMAGAFLSYLVLGPLLATFGDKLNVPISPAESKVVLKAAKKKAESPADGVFGGTRPGEPHQAWRAASLVAGLGQPYGQMLVGQSAHLSTQVQDQGLIRNMSPGGLKGNFLRYIGAGAVAAGGIISMLRALPLILSSIVSGLRDLRATRAGLGATVQRTDRDMSMQFVLFGSLGMVLVMMFIPSLGLGVSFQGFLGALMILLFGFLFVTVSSRLTGEIGSSSNPISGMTIATLLMTCLVFLLVSGVGVDPTIYLTALTVAAVVCIASSNGGTTSQDLKTGYLVGATPRSQQLSILVGALTSSLVIGGTMLALNAAGTHYTNKNLPPKTLIVPADATTQHVGKPYQNKDDTLYRVVHVRRNDQDNPGVAPGRYLVDAQGKCKYRTDMPIDQKSSLMDDGEKAPKAFVAPQPQLFANIIEGILGGTLEWSLFIIGVLIALSLELAGVRSLPFAVGMYLPLSVSTPIMIGGLIRWITDKARGTAASDVETETSPGVLLSSGYIAGGTLCGLLLAFLEFAPTELKKLLDIGALFGKDYGKSDLAQILALIAFGCLAGLLLQIGMKKSVETTTEPPAGPETPVKG